MKAIAKGTFVLMAGFLAFGVQRPQPNPVQKWQPSELIRPQELIVKVRDNGPSKPVIIFTLLMFEVT